MKLEIIMSNKFKKDLKTAAKRNNDLGLLNEVVDTLASGLVLPPKYRDHELTGDFSGFRECHIKPDWLLVYRVVEEKLVLLLFRTGTHSDLF